MKKIILSICCLSFYFGIIAQSNDMNQLPYYEIPAYPEAYEAETIAARMIDGLGYRYFWATKDLREEDLNYKPSEDSRTAKETLDHIYGLSEVVKNGALNKPNIRPAQQTEMSFEEKRKATLENIKAASDFLRTAAKGTTAKSKVIFQRGEQTSEFPFWNLLNGPLADAIYHVGQIVAYRRASGNPMDSRVSVFSGKTRE